MAGIGYTDHVGVALDILIDIVTSHPLMLPDPPPTVDVLELAASSVDLAARSGKGTAFSSKRMKKT
jgi:small conductance mechanosensitive channel